MVSMPHVVIKFRAKGDMFITRKFDLKPTQEYYAQSFKVTNTWLGSLLMAIPTGLTLLQQGAEQTFEFTLSSIICTRLRKRISQKLGSRTNVRVHLAEYSIH